MTKALEKLRSFMHLSITILSLLFFTCFTCAGKPLTKHEIHNYTPVFLPLYDNYNQLRIAIRSYDQDSIQYFVLVDPYTLKTQVITADATKPISLDKKTNPKSISSSLTLTPYIRALHTYKMPPYKLQNYGATATLYQTNSVFLTVDMCPSTKKFAKPFFDELLSLHEKNLTATPIAISVSGLWMLQHTEEFNWLKEQSFLGTLEITWVNHSFSHPYVPSVPNEHNFLLTDEEKFEQEVLQTEKILVENNLIPSIFFRYPGLVANEALIKKLNNLSLIPLGSNAWLAKGEPITPGAFILVHGNGNEPAGIEIIMPLLPRLSLLPIQKAFIPHQSESDRLNK